MFYPADPNVLNRDVDQLLTEATSASSAEADSVEGSPKRNNGKLRAVIVPHAGYIYSGLTAATAYALIGHTYREGQIYDRVVIVGPTHRVGVQGAAYPTATAFATPLGEMPLWDGIANALTDVAGVNANDETHHQEHAIEVQLPFLQKVLPKVPLIPLNTGNIRPEVLADILENLLTDNTLLVISSDLSHYLPYDEANEIDAYSLGRILSLAGPLAPEQGCGATPINGLLELARRRGWVPELLAASNSGDTAGDKQRVVGYCAFAFYSPEELGSRHCEHSEAGQAPLVELGSRHCEHGEAIQKPIKVADQLETGVPDEAGAVLLAHARSAIEHRLGIFRDNLVPAWGEWANQRAATFVTLTKNGELRGCIGSLGDERPLQESIPANARSAAFSDPRFMPVEPQEWPDIAIEVSVLTPPQHLLVEYEVGDLRNPVTEAEALAALTPGIDGVIFKAGSRQATYLPQVWEQIPDPKQFLASLRQKAGLAPDYWGDDVELLTYRVKAWEE
jgi:AmmeMemoRadiSam system protein B/AmmeMemoRadiSam system protein A